MTYVNAIRVLPPELVAALQDYVEGQLLYIPRRRERRRGWGTKSGVRQLFGVRNEQIRQDYLKGRRIGQLAEEFHLSEDSIRKIVAGQG
jgi:Mor family transcriptional regulator